MKPSSPTSSRDQLMAAWVVRILQIGTAGCFIGHGAFGVITKAGWLPYFGVVGLSSASAWKLMPWVGTMDIAIGLMVLIRPCRALLCWGVLWTVWTALLRPLSGESAWEFVERAGNYFVPLTWIAIAGLRTGWFSSLLTEPVNLTGERRRYIAWAMRLGAAMLLCGHGACGFFLHKMVFAQQYAAIHLPAPGEIVPWIGAVEFALAAAVLLRPSSRLLVFVALWKIGTEALYPITGSPIWEFVERFGSYTLPLALAVLLYQRARKADIHPESTPSITIQSSSC